MKALIPNAARPAAVRRSLRAAACSSCRPDRSSSDASAAPSSARRFRRRDLRGSSCCHHISGNARGRWYFEASAPVELQDAQGNVIAQGHITAQGDWMTEDFVPFTATLTFTKQPAGSTGTLVLQNDNPSGDPARGFELDIPVKF